MYSFDFTKKSFGDFLRLERQLSENTLVSYLHDVSRYLEFIKSKNIESFDTISQKHVRDFLHILNELDLSSASIARNISAIKRFHLFAESEGIAKTNPTHSIQQPKLKRALPPVMSIEDIDLLLKQIDLTIRPGLRDRAMIEVIYSCGLRVSELLSLKFEHFYEKDEVLRIFGKGNKERIVPIGEHAMFWIKEYVYKERPFYLKTLSSSNYIFLNQRGISMTRMGFWKILRAYIEQAGLNLEIHPHTF